MVAFGQANFKIVETDAPPGVSVAKMPNVGHHDHDHDQDHHDRTFAASAEQANADDTRRPSTLASRPNRQAAAW